MLPMAADRLRLISWKVGQVTGPVLVGTDGYRLHGSWFHLAAGFIVVATTAFVVTGWRAQAGAS